MYRVDPGLLIVKVSHEHEPQWVALRSPIPNFGGREPLPEDGNPEDFEDVDNPQYNVVFTPWDAQFDEMDREDYGFCIADPDVKKSFEGLISRLTSYGQSVPSVGQPGYDIWRQSCLDNLTAWCGTGIRL